MDSFIEKHLRKIINVKSLLNQTQQQQQTARRTILRPDLRVWKKAAKMSDNLMEKVSAFGERLKIGGAEVGRKMSAGMSSMSFKVKELLQGPNQADKLVEDATAETLDDPDWAMNLDICDMINHEKVSSVELIRGIKKRIVLKSARVQYLALVLLETCAKNCEKAFSEVAAERVLDEMSQPVSCVIYLFMKKRTRV
ncbi:hypothetical protein OIU78_022706 [Salix suchowensis]|nr:hypothetical protein OIU78_022706 [Salix suchowensis]